MKKTNGMLLMHESNLLSKIENNYKGDGNEIKQFMDEVYFPTRKQLLSIDFNHPRFSDFERAAELINFYFSQLKITSDRLSITSQSKFESTFYEEISNYLFKDLPEIKNGMLAIFNKGIYAGLKIDNQNHIAIIKKDVDFCIGKKAKIRINDQEEMDLILPVVSVEVKTYLDATMFGEIKSSSKAIRSASPNSKAYVLIGYKDLADEHIIAARQDSTLTEIFALRKDKNSPIDPNALCQYHNEIRFAVSEIGNTMDVATPGRLLFPKE